MKPLLLILTMAAFALPAKASNTPVWKTMDDEDLKTFTEIILQRTQISPEVAFGKTEDFGKSRLRVRTYPRGDQELLVVESTVAKDREKEVIRSVQLKRVKDDGSVEIRWEVLPGKPAPASAPIRVEDLQWRLEKPRHHGPTDVPAEKLFRSVS